MTFKPQTLGLILAASVSVAGCASTPPPGTKKYDGSAPATIRTTILPAWKATNLCAKPAKIYDRFFDTTGKYLGDTLVGQTKRSVYVKCDQDPAPVLRCYTPITGANGITDVPIRCPIF